MARNLRDVWGPWLGDTEVTDEQLELLQRASEMIDARYPDADLEDSRREALNAAFAVIIGDDSLEGYAERWADARRAEREAMEHLTGAIIAASSLLSEPAIATFAGVTRGTVRTALGKGR